MSRKYTLGLGWSACKWDVLTVAGKMRFEAQFKYPFVIIKWDENRYTLNHSLTNNCIVSCHSQSALAELVNRLLCLHSAQSYVWKDWESTLKEIDQIVQGWKEKYSEYD